jgi:hypothetical protein
VIVKKTKASFLFATPTLVSGAARALDLYGVYDVYNASSTENEADYKALLSDWSIVGQDIFSAMKQFEGCLPPDSDVHRNQLRGDGQQMSLFRES